mmetsp:Transcript_51367/g.135447  ORF Transcript_51367/g.135447 Transcript_51367/m.135447 type:complete len:294 (-) Transcript_51367:2736-3617(-)
MTQALEILGHHHQSLERFLKIRESHSHPAQQPVVSFDLLHKHCVHGLLIANREPASNVGLVKKLRSRRFCLLGEREGTVGLGVAAARLRNQGRDIVHELPSLAHSYTDVGVGVQSKHLRPSRDRQIANKLQPLLPSLSVAAEVLRPRRKCVRRAQDVRTDIRFQQCGDQPLVLVIGHAAAVVDPRTDGPQNLVRHFGILVQKDPQLKLANIKIFIREVVGNIPSDRAEAPPLLHHCVEEGKSKQQFAERHRLCTAFQRSGVQGQIGPLQIRTQALGRLRRELDSALQDGDWER